jgi:hypothetical protein
MCGADLCRFFLEAFVVCGYIIPEFPQDFGQLPCCGIALKMHKESGLFSLFEVSYLSGGDSIELLVGNSDKVYVIHITVASHQQRNT